MIDRPQFTRVVSLALGSLVAVTFSVAVAASSGNAIKINADQIILDQSSRQMNYRGSVRVRHGELAIYGDHAVASSDASGARQVVVDGAPARAIFTDNNRKSVKLTANRLRYDSVSGSIEARDDVTIDTANGVIRGQVVRYDIEADRFTVTGKTNGPGVSASFPINPEKESGDNTNQ